MTKKTIVKFWKRKPCQQVLREKKELKNVDPSEFDFPEGTAIFINQSVLLLQDAMEQMQEALEKN